MPDLRPGSLSATARSLGRHTPLRARLTAVVVLLLTVGIAVTGLAATYALRNFMIARQDQELLSTATQHVASALLEQRTEGDRKVPYTSGTYVVRLVTSTGAADYFTSEKPVPDWPDLSPSWVAAHRNRPLTVPSVEADVSWRMVAGTMTENGRQVTYAVAVPLTRVDDTVDKLIALIAVSGLVTVVSGAAVGWYLVRRAFRPLREIEDTARDIADGDLTQRVPERESRDEVSSLAHSLNVMLGHIERSFALQEQSEERMRRFVADASHELRTPLATVRGYAELFRQGAVSRPEDVASALRRIEDEAARMGVLVEDLLLLTRLDPRVAQHVTDADRPFQAVDLTVLAADAVQDALALDHARDIRLTGLDGPVQPTFVAGDEPRLRQVLTNLLANAVRYTPAGSDIEVLVGATAGQARLEVRDHGPGIRPELRDRVFERFYRTDVSRNSATGGSGLGLAIVQAIVAAHEGTVAVRETPGGGATFIIELPVLSGDLAGLVDSPDAR